MTADESLPESWNFVNFGSVLDGGTRTGIYKQKQFHGSGIKMINMGELFAYPKLKSVPMERIQLTDDEKGRFDIQVGDLIFARRSLVASGAGKCSLVCEVLEPTTFESSIIRARPDPKLADSEYIFYLFNSPLGKHLLDTILRQVAVSGITGSDLVKLQIPLPPLPTQHAIAHVLGLLDDKIELNRQMNETLEMMARAIFQSWFVDFDPVRAKAEGRDTGLPPEVAALFPSEFEVVNGRDVPKGWGITTLVQSVQFVKGKKPDEISDISLEGYEQQILIDTFNGNNPIYAKNDNCVLSSEDNVLMVMDGASSGRVEIGFKGVIGSTIAKLKIINEIITPPILFYYLKTKEIEIQENTTGTSIPHADRKRIEQFEIVIPNNDLFTKYSEFAGLILEKIQNNKRESRTLAQIRDALLPKLMSGEICV
jgi:type I restriction enzyme S subunit